MPYPDIYLEKLLAIYTYLRWLVVLGLWLTIGVSSLWALREDISLWLSYFTWSAVRTALRATPLPFMGLGVCVGTTLGVLIWQSTYILFGFSPQQRQAFNRHLAIIAKWDKSHPWIGIKRFIFGTKTLGTK